MILDKIFDFLNHPIIAIIILLLFCVGFFVYNALTNKKTNHFFSFGPTKDDDGKPISFLGTELDNWGHVWVAYILIFVASLFNHYYNDVIDHNILHHLTNTAVDKMPFNKLITYIVILVDPFMKTLLYIIEFYAVATFQIQYIIPQFIGAYLINLPFSLHLMNSKKFV